MFIEIKFHVLSPSTQSSHVKRPCVFLDYSFPLRVIRASHSHSTWGFLFLHASSLDLPVLLSSSLPTFLRGFISITIVHYSITISAVSALYISHTFIHPPTVLFNTHQVILFYTSKPERYCILSLLLSHHCHPFHITILVFYVQSDSVSAASGNQLSAIRQWNVHDFHERSATLANADNVDPTRQ